MKSMWLGIWMMGVGISANADCVDFTGAFERLPERDTTGLPSRVVLDQKSCEEILVKMTNQGHDSIFTAKSDATPERSEEGGSKAQILSEFSNDKISITLEVWIPSMPYFSQKYLITLAAPGVLLVESLQTRANQETEVAKAYFVKVQKKK